MADQTTDSATTAARRRALLVCFRCHGKKIKCDLDDESATRPCTHCSQAQAQCRVPSEAASVIAAEGLTSDQCSIPPSYGLADRQTQAASEAVSAHLVLLQPTREAPGQLIPPQLEASTSSERPVSTVNYHTLIPSPAPSDADATPSAGNPGTKQASVQASSFGYVGYMPIFSQNNVVEEDKVQQSQLSGVEPISPALQESFAESYFEYCYAWCPVLDQIHLHGRGTAKDSPLLQHSLALCGTRINPPLIQYRDPAFYYNRAQELFYNNSEGRALVRLSSTMLFFWWSSGAPNQLNMANAWWWTGISIRVAQECGLHREPEPHELVQLWETTGLRRRIWWTLFARDRILSISQGRPTIIDLDFCSVRMVTAQDFPDPSDTKAQIFIHWVGLLDISGRISKQFSRTVGDRTDTASFSRDLISWVQSLPEVLSLSSLRTRHTTSFHRDTHRLYVTYLATVTLLHLTGSSQLLPRASTAAIVAASCMARLFEDILARGSIRFLTGEAGWEIVVGLLALLHARRAREDLRAHADADIQTLLAALRQMALLWPSARMFASAFDRLSRVETLAAPLTNPQVQQHQPENNTADGNDNPDMMGGYDRVDKESDTVGWIGDGKDEDTTWIDAFPFVSEDTSPLIGAVLARNLGMPSLPEFNWPLDINTTLQEFLEPGDYSFDMLNL